MTQPKYNSDDGRGMTFEEFLTEAFKNPTFVKEYEALRSESELLGQFLKARKKMRLTKKKSVNL